MFKRQPAALRLKVADAVEVFINELVAMVGGRSVHEGDVAVEVNIRIETALNKQLAEPVTTLAYHFDVHGYTVTVTVPLDPAENSVPTITPWFRNADWNEREFAELFDVHVDGNTNPKRLFLDPEIDEGILNEVIPLTIMMNGACTKDMWERIMEVNAEPGEEVEKGVHE